MENHEGSLIAIYLIDAILVVIGITIWHFTQHQWWTDCKADKAKLEADQAQQTGWFRGPAPAPVSHADEDHDQVDDERSVRPADVDNFKDVEEHDDIKDPAPIYTEDPSDMRFSEDVQMTAETFIDSNNENIVVEVAPGEEPEPVSAPLPVGVQRTPVG